MAGILVSGLINIETTLRIDGFPLNYAPVYYPFFGVRSTVSGVGYNVTVALSTLGQDVAFVSLLGNDLPAELVRQTLRAHWLDDRFILPLLSQTPQSVILYDPDGRRQIHTDLKDIQEQSYPQDTFTGALADSSLVVLCNVNYNRPFLQQARRAGKTVATDVHAIADLADAYNADFMAAADILFMSDELLPCAPEEWARLVQERYGTPILVIGLGSQGALLAVKEDNFLERVPALAARPVVNTIGAGDALFSAFVHSYRRAGDPYAAIRRAVLFAGYKIGAVGAAEGFLTEQELEELVAQHGG